MNIQTTKLDLIKLILSIDNAELIQKISDLVYDKKSDFWNDLSIQTKKDILEGISDLDNGRKTSIENVLNKIA